MLARASILFCAVVLFGSWAMLSLVRNHVNSVAMVHAQDKMQHKTDMIENLRDIALVFGPDGASDQVFDQINHMAHDSDIVEMVFFDLAGARVAMKDAPPSSMGGMDHSQRQQGMTDAHVHHAQAVDQGNHSHNGVEGAAVPTAPDELGADVLTRAQGAATMTSLPIVSAVFPIHGASGARLGYVWYKVDVTDVMAAYSSGLTWFATVLVLFGIGIFGVPATGFIIQKRIADRSNSDAKYLASFDALTGLLNRRGFMARADAKVQSGALKCLAYIDVDAFKSVNDTYGHAIGDRYLKTVADVIREVFSEVTVSARLGGDEFVIADENANHERFVASLERLRKRCAAELDLDGVTVSTSVSVGMATLKPGQSLEELLSDADMALYFAKADGGNTVSVFDPKMAEELERLRALEARLKEAVAQRDFVLHYQPLVHSQSQQVYGYEALLRLLDRDGVNIPPDDFIPLAEKMGLIEEIGTWVLKTATRQVAGLSSSDMIAVNLSSEQFKSGKLVGIVQDALAQAALPPERLELEITESLLLDDSIDVSLQIDALKDLGVSVAMDDFGTGFSSLSYLWRFGFDRLKIDRSFVRALEEDSHRSLGLVESIVLLGKKLNMSITAEGVETLTQSEILSDLGCDTLQGYYFGRPEPLTLPAPEAGLQDRPPKQA